MKVRELFETQVPTYKGDINVPEDWKDLSGLPELYPGYTAGCKLIGDFYCCDCTSLTSLEGAPQSVSGYFDCTECRSLTSLEGAPQEVGSGFSCYGCRSLTSLEGGPIYVSGNFSCIQCSSLTSLEGAPQEVGGNFICTGCKSLVSLKGAPQQVGYTFSCSECTSLTSLEGAPQQVGYDFSCYECTSLTSLKGIGKQYLKKCDNELFLFSCKNLKSHMLGILLIKDLKKISFSDNIEVQNIINKHLDGDRDILECQEELITNGLKEFAKL
jgi:hypothetical protein